MKKVQCIICDTEVLIDENTLEAKQLNNNPIRTFMCGECKSRLDVPKQRHNLYKEKDEFHIEE
ncbi:DUF2197 domain-containing protein [Staphylococcus carnosus]|uniref:DUF2197 domain-containing protein n=1 Tax=Staphylococcus carnosus (strain TM300) TaxID=396513 RepID=B9DQ06_STACT|nr:DUF2197 domain-containing protein [Staphylococcus carnosus]KOR11971.1 hypothetical protein AMC75_11420 [Staphylococcus carnosus]QPT03814.1 DUF2197 domain-containing protein [Staphylococcus carnosus]UQA66539.1 YlaI family protein [Staphylococcus carnosus]UTB78630.1 hypothetical protein A2I62_08720 [Staphylococcus carnosus]UTB88180.1 hypothetical protein A2I63_08710 [Staphylococcus carnosus]